MCMTKLPCAKSAIEFIIWLVILSVLCAVASMYGHDLGQRQQRSKSGAAIIELRDENKLLAEELRRCGEELYAARTQLRDLKQ